MADDNWRRLADYVVAGRVAMGLRDRRALAAATGVTERTLGKLENGHRVSASTLAAIENKLGWVPGSCRRILAGGEPVTAGPVTRTPGGAAPVTSVPSPVLAAVPAMDRAAAEHDEQAADSTLSYLADTPGLPPEVVRGLIALARNWREADGEAPAGADDDVGAAAQRRRA
jgi:hypothetical protein